MKYLVILSLLLSGCATYPVRCPDKRLPAETAPDTPQAISAVSAGDLESLVKLLLEGRVVRDQRLAEDDAQIKACSQ